MDEILVKSDELLIKIYKKINCGIALSDFENGVYQTLKWIIETECDDDCAPDIALANES